MYRHIYTLSDMGHTAFGIPKATPEEAWLLAVAGAVHMQMYWAVLGCKPQGHMQPMQSWNQSTIAAASLRNAHSARCAAKLVTDETISMRRPMPVSTHRTGQLAHGG